MTMTEKFFDALRSIAGLIYLIIFTNIYPPVHKDFKIFLDGNYFVSENEIHVASENNLEIGITFYVRNRNYSQFMEKISATSFPIELTIKSKNNYNYNKTVELSSKIAGNPNYIIKLISYVFLESGNYIVSVKFNRDAIDWPPDDMALSIHDRLIR